MGFDIPAPKAPLRWGFAKVARKSGAFAHSIAIVATQGKDGPVSAVLGAAGPRPLPLAATANQLALDRQHGGAGARRDRRPISTPISPELDAYQKRMHTANILRAVRDMRAQ